MVRRPDGYYCQFCVAIEVKETLQATHNTIGVDVGLKEFYTDSKGNKESNPRYYRKSEPKLKKDQRRVSREDGPVAEAAQDFDVLENLRLLAFSENVPRPKQLELWLE